MVHHCSISNINLKLGPIKAEKAFENKSKKGQKVKE